MEDIGEKGVANLIFLGFRNGKRAISNVGFFGDSRPWMLFLKLSRIVGVSRSALPKTIMQLTKNAGLEDDSAFQSGDFLWFPCFFVRGLYVSTVEKFHRGGGQPLNTWKFSGLYITQPWRPLHCHQWGNLRWKDGEIIIMAFSRFV